MISIKRFLDQRPSRSGEEQDVAEALERMSRLLLEGAAANAVRVREADYLELRRTFQELARRMEEPHSAIGLLGVSSDALEALETYCQRAHEYLGQEREQMRSMVAMLTETVAELAGHADASVARLQAIDRKLEAASGLNDIRELRSSLESCLHGLREAAAQERARSAVTGQRLRDHLDLVRTRLPEEAPPGDAGLPPELSDEEAEPESAAWVAAFKLQRSEHIANRFGEDVRRRMLAAIGSELKAVLGPQDRLLRWKGTSFVMFINSAAAPGEIKARLFGAVAATGQQYIELGRKSAMLAVGVDWILFPQSDHPSLEAVLNEVDAFLANARPETASPGMAMMGGALCRAKTVA